MPVYYRTISTDRKTGEKSFRDPIELTEEEYLRSFDPLAKIILNRMREEMRQEKTDLKRKKKSRT